MRADRPKPDDSNVRRAIRLDTELLPASRMPKLMSKRGEMIRAYVSVARALQGRGDEILVTEELHDYVDGQRAARGPASCRR